MGRKEEDKEVKKEKKKGIKKKVNKRGKGYKRCKTHIGIRCK